MVGVSDTQHTEATLSDAIMRTWGNVHSQGEGIRYVVALQVHNGAGFAYRRRLDAVVFDTWPSKGLVLHGLEIKCSKSDLRRELQQPDKAADFTEYLDTFSIVAPKEIIDRDLIPKRWGIYVPDEKGTLRTVRKPLYLHDDGRDRAVVDRSIMAAFSRALVQRSLSKEAEDRAYSLGKEHGERAAAHKLEQAEGARDTLQQAVDAFEAASGVKITRYSGDVVGEAFAAFQRLRAPAWGRGLPIVQVEKALEQMHQIEGDLKTLAGYLNGEVSD